MDDKARKFYSLCDTVSDILDDLVNNQDIVETTHRKVLVSFIIKKLQHAHMLHADLYDNRLATIGHYDVTNKDGIKIKEVAEDGQVIWERDLSNEH